VGRALASVKQNRPDLRFPFPERFAARLEGRQIVSVERRAKYILIRLDDESIWLVHLGMSGRFVVDGQGGAARSGQAGAGNGWRFDHKHDHLVARLDDGGILIFNDPRRFGFMDLFPASTMAEHPRLAELGPEPLSDGFNPAYLGVALKGKRTPIKAALLDQEVVAGLGNIYVCEALWRASVSPRRMASSIPGRRAARLVENVKSVLRDAIQAGGSSLRDFVQASGELGYFQHSWQVYDREQEPCGFDGCSGRIRRIVQSGRSTFYCAKHQR